MTITHNFQQESVLLLHNAIVQVSKRYLFFFETVMEVNIFSPENFNV